MLEPAARSTFLTDAHLFDGRRGRPNALLWHSLTSWRPTAGPQHARRGSGDEKRQPKRAVAARATPCERTAAVPFGQRHRTRRPSASAPARPPPRPARHVVRFLAYLRFADAAGPLPHCIWKLARRLFRSAPVAERHRAEQPTAGWLASCLASAAWPSTSSRPPDRLSSKLLLRPCGGCGCAHTSLVQRVAVIPIDGRPTVG